MKGGATAKEPLHWVKSGCAAEPAPQSVNFGSAGNAGAIVLKGRLQPTLFYDSLRYPLLLIFPPDRVEVSGNAVGGILPIPWFGAVSI